MLAVNLRRQLTPSLLGTLRTAAASFSASAEPAEALDGASLISIDGHGCVVLNPHINGDAPASSSKVNRTARTRPRSSSPRPRRHQQRWQPRRSSEPHPSFAAQDVSSTTDAGRLSLALASAPSILETAKLLVAQRAIVDSHHLLQAICQMGRLQRLSGSRGWNPSPAPADQEAFAGTLEVAFELLAGEKRQLSFRECCQLLEASAWMALPLTPDQQAVIEAALVQSLTTGGGRGFDGGSATMAELLFSSYLRLGMQPGSQLAAALARLRDGNEKDNSAADDTEASLHLPQQQEQQQQQQDSSLTDVNPSGRLTLKLRWPSSYARLLKLLVLHSSELDLIHLMTALFSMVRLRNVCDATGTTACRQQAFETVMQRTLAVLASRDAEAAAAAGPKHVCQISVWAARMGVHLSSDQEAAMEAVVLRSMPALESSCLRSLVSWCVRHGGQSSSALQAAVTEAAERLLPAVQSPQELAGILECWQTLGWRVTSTLESAAQGAALSMLTATPPPTAFGVLRLLQGFAEGRWPLTPELAGELRLAVLRGLPGAKARWVSSTLSCCRKLGLLPEEQLQGAFLAAAQASLPDADLETSLALLARLLLPLQPQGWQFSTAPPAMQVALKSLLHQLQRKIGAAMEGRAAAEDGQGQHLHPHPRFILGSMAHCLQLLSAVGLQPGDGELKAFTSYLKRHQRHLSPKQRDWVRGAYEAWQREGGRLEAPFPTSAGEG